MMKRRKRSKGSRSFSQKSDPFRKVISEIRVGKSFLVTTHANPDGDALGSALALAEGLRRLKKKVKVYNADPVPGNLRFLPNADHVLSELLAGESFDASFIVDCSEPDRVGESFKNYEGRGKLIIVDHHVTGKRVGDVQLIDPKAASTGSLVCRLLQKMRVPISRSIAYAVYTTLVTDTGNFRYSNTDASVLGLAKSLVEKGVVPWVISKNLYENFPLPRLKLLARVLLTLEISADGRYASILITQEMLRETCATADLSDEFINYPRSIATVEVAIQFRETPEGKWKVSFRSKDRVDVANLAARFGGGGHVRAAGCTLECPFDEVKKTIDEAVQEALRN